MILLRRLEDLPASLRHGAVSIGNFDGVHAGHRDIGQRLVALAQRHGGPPIVFTFDPHPATLLRPDRVPPPLVDLERKASLLGELGVAALIAYPTDRALLSLSAGEFFQSIVVERLAARALVEGPDFCFGRGREGNVDVLRGLCQARGLELDVVAPYQIEGEPVSSSRIRRAIVAGDVALAARLLTRPHRIGGTVIRGAGRGAGLGFPTANLAEIAVVVPAPGVYAGQGHLADRSFPAAIHVGPNPTFGEAALKVEVHLIGHDGPLYGERLEVDFTRSLRGVMRFDSVDALRRQLSQDVADAAQ